LHLLSLLHQASNITFHHALFLRMNVWFYG